MLENIGKLSRSENTPPYLESATQELGKCIVEEILVTEFS
jgi:hypothetical protein